jgi:hypothetical protein
METIMENQVSVINKSLDLIKTGPEILIANRERKDKALTVGRNILSAILEKGMDSPTDERAKNYLININNAAKEMKEGRAGVTQIMDQLKRMYTEVEGELDVKNNTTIPGQIQAHRNRYAAHLAAEAERKRKEAERVAAKSKEAIDIKYSIETTYKINFHAYLLARKQKMQSGFNDITLDNYNIKAENLKSLSITCNIQHSGLYTSVAMYHNSVEIKSFVDAVILENEKQLTDNFLAEMNLLKDELIDKLPSKLTELQEQKRLADEAAAEKERSRLAEEKRQLEIAAANAKEKKRLEAEAAIEREKEKQRQEELKKQQDQADADRKKREAEEQDKLKLEAEESQRKSQLDADVKKQGEQTMVLFEQEAMMADTATAPEVRQGYEITVLHPVGYTQIFAIWFENEGKNLPVDKIGNTKLDQMKAWAEKHAHKTGSKIDSKFIKYNESFKAINRKAK